MASETPSRSVESVQLELTEVESKLRQLLLDVAAYIDEQPASKDDTTAVEVPESLAGEKIVLRWTGGWVRDKLLNVGSHDVDLAINKMTGEHFGLKLQEYLEIPGNAEKHGLIEKSDKTDKLSGKDKAKRIAPGLHKIEANPEKSKNLETATTNIMGIDLDLVNLRKETYNEISRNPQMEFGTAEEDAVRRDATVNAMFFNLHTCQVEDFTGQGFDDMAAKIIRTPLEPVQTFKDDPLRVLRLIRFASRLDYTIEPETEKAMANPEIQEVLKIKISRERVGIELEKMLKGPRPHRALELINSFGLYRTVFTDPTRELPADPETSLFQPAFEFISSIALDYSIADHLLRNAEEKYLAWICATMMPWADAPTVPHQKPLQRPYFSAYLVAREGFKAPNKVCDVVAASLGNGEEIRSLVAQCARGLQRPDTINPTSDATARDTLGMAIRRWGSTWRTQVLFNLTYEVVRSNTPGESHIRSYSLFLSHLAKLEVLDADTFKPLLKGTDLAKALSTKPGPWMKDALDVVMAWQLRNPSATDSAEAIEAVRKARESDSELPQRLASHFLKLTIPPLFPQLKSTNRFEVSQTPAPWKDSRNEYLLALLGWSTKALDRKAIEQHWHLLVPPILKMVDDMEAEFKAKGCNLLTQLLFALNCEPKVIPNTLNKPSKPTVAFSQKTSATFLARTGYHEVFTSTLWPLFTFIPSLTPESESVTIFRSIYEPLRLLALLSTSEDSRIRLLDKLVREGVLAPLSHFPTSSAYPDLACEILRHVPEIVELLGIETVKHLSSLIPLLTSTLQEPFVLAHKGLVLATLDALQGVIRVTWPRVPGHRGSITLGLCVLKMRCVEEAQEEGRGKLEEVWNRVQDTADLLDTVLSQSEVCEEWRREKAELMDADEALKGLFDQKVEGDLGA